MWILRAASKGEAMKRVVIYYVRHGKTEYNRDHIMQGGRVDAPLAPEALWQIEDTRRAFESIQIDAAWCSPQGRARRTAELILAGHNIAAEPLEELREVDFGTMDGTSLNKLGTKLRFGLGFVRQDFRPWGGECAAQIRARAAHAFKHIYTQAQDGDAVLVVAHGALFRYLLSLYGQEGPAAVRSRTVRVENVSIATFVAEDAGIRLVHLPVSAKEFRPQAR